MKSAIVAGIALSMVSAVAMADVNAALNSFAAYGNVSGLTGGNGSTTGGIGLKGSAYTDNFLFSANYHHDFSSQFDVPGATGDGSNIFNVKAGYLVPFSQNFAIGPYVTYQYTRWNINGPAGDGSLHLTNNALGGGLMAGIGAGPLDMVAHIGYLGGVSATYSYTDSGYRYATTTTSGSLNVLNLGAQADYFVAGPVYLFTGFDWDRYSDHGSRNVLQGNFGVGMSF